MQSGPRCSHDARPRQNSHPKASASRRLRVHQRARARPGNHRAHAPPLIRLTQRAPQRRPATSDMIRRHLRFRNPDRDSPVGRPRLIPLRLTRRSDARAPTAPAGRRQHTGFSEILVDVPAKRSRPLPGSSAACLSFYPSVAQTTGRRRGPSRLCLDRGLNVRLNASSVTLFKPAASTVAETMARQRVAGNSPVKRLRILQRRCRPGAPCARDVRTNFF
jgi:hypothetical protein